MNKVVLELILVGAKLFGKERERYYTRKAEGLLKTIQDVEDSDFYSKDMEAKGKAEREINNKVNLLAMEQIKENKK